MTCVPVLGSASQEEALASPHSTVAVTALLVWLGSHRRCLGVAAEAPAPQTAYPLPPQGLAPGQRGLAAWDSCLSNADSPWGPRGFPYMAVGPQEPALEEARSGGRHHARNLSLEPPARLAQSGVEAARGSPAQGQEDTVHFSKARGTRVCGHLPPHKGTSSDKKHRKWALSSSMSRPRHLEENAA